MMPGEVITVIEVQWRKGDGDLSQCLAIRDEVFTGEQGYDAAVDQDAYDASALHVLVFDGGEAVGTARLFFCDGAYRIGRVAVRKAWRGTGVGDLMMRVLLRKAFDMGAAFVELHAQSGARGFYEKLGMRVIGGEYEEEGRLHVTMRATEGDIFGKSCAGDR